MESNRIFMVTRGFGIIFLFSIIMVLAGLSAPDGSVAVVKADTSYTFSHPNMYLNQAEIADIKARINNREEPWFSAYNDLISTANAALTQPELSVLSDGGDHYWRTDKPYLTDGVYDPNAHRDDYLNANKVSDAIRDLALAYTFTKDTRYANKAVRLIKVWFLDKNTYMEPFIDNKGPATAGHRSAGAIEIWITLPAAFYGADLLWNYDGWSAADKTALKQWASVAVSRLKAFPPRTNNWENWRMVFIMSMATIAEDKSAMDYAFNRWKALVPIQIGNDGLLTQELGRTRSLDYSMFALNPMVQGAEIAKHYGVNLYDYTASQGRGLEKVFDAYVKYVKNPSSWPHQQISPFKSTDGVQAYELGYTFRSKQSYKSVINKFGRPMKDMWTQGPVTLTHSKRTPNFTPSSFVWLPLVLNKR